MCFLLNDSHPLHKSMFWVAQQKRKKNNKPMSKKTDKEKLPNLFVGQVLYYQIKRNNNEIPI